jgi:hypothetical protein
VSSLSIQAVSVKNRAQHPLEPTAPIGARTIAAFWFWWWVCLVRRSRPPGAAAQMF